VLSYKSRVVGGAEGSIRERRPEMADETYTFVCTVCGWEVEVDTPELPEDFVCEVCGVGADMFELVED
jgi:rubredoxin